MGSQAEDKATDPVEDEAPKATEEQAEQVKPELKVVPRATPLVSHRLQLAVEINTTFNAQVPEGVTPEQCMDEAFWSHIAMRFSIGDTLIVRPDTMDWELVLHVADCGREYAHVVKKHFYDLKVDAKNRPAAARYTVDFAGPVHKFRFLRDGVVMRDGFASKKLAQRAAENHQMAVDRGK